MDVINKYRDSISLSSVCNKKMHKDICVVWDTHSQNCISKLRISYPQQNDFPQTIFEQKPGIITKRMNTMRSKIPYSDKTSFRLRFACGTLTRRLFIWNISAVVSLNLLLCEGFEIIVTSIAWRYWSEVKKPEMKIQFFFRASMHILDKTLRNYHP